MYQIINEMQSISQRCSYNSVGLQCNNVGVARPHTQSDTPTYTWKNSSERVISTLQRPLPTQHTTSITDEYPLPQRDSNRRSQPSTCFRLTTSRKLGHRAWHKEVQHFQIPVQHQINDVLENVTEGKVEQTGRYEDVSSFWMTERERMKCPLSVS